MSRYQDLFPVPEALNPAPIGEVAPDAFTIEINDLCEFVRRQLRRADDSGRPWNARVMAAGAVPAPDPTRPGKVILVPDDSWAIVIRIAAPSKVLLPAPTEPIQGTPPGG